MDPHNPRHHPAPHSTPTDPIGLVLKALSFAALKHRDQRRKDEEASPYINHPIALANLLWHEGGVSDATVLCAALLHDTVEDTDTSPDELRAEFGNEIADVVLEVTDDKLLSQNAIGTRSLESQQRF